MHITDDCGEKSLATELRRGDASALRRFYALYAGSMAGVCSRYVANDDDAKALAEIAEILPKVTVPRADPQPNEEW